MKRATIRDVAAAAGVSTQTVSRVVNGHQNVLPSTRLRVQAAIDELHYRPSALARGLQSNRTNTIGVLLWGTQHYGPSQTLVGIVEESTRQGVTVLLSELPDDIAFDPERALSILSEHRVDGVIVSVPRVGATVERVIETFAVNSIPVVFVRVGAPSRCSGVSLDNRAAMHRVVEHLVGLGRNRIGHIAGPAWWDEAAERRTGWRDALVAHGLAAPPTFEVEGDWTPGSGAAAAIELMRRHPDLDAIVAANDHMALGALRVLQREGVRVPDDIALTGFDDIPEVAWSTPTITSVSQPLRDIGCEAVRMVLGHVSDPRRPTAVVTLRAELVVRESTCGPEHPPASDVRTGEDPSALARTDTTSALARTDTTSARPAPRRRAKSRST